MSSIKETIVVGCALIAALAIVAHCTACGSKQTEPAIIEKRAKNALDLERYGRDLAACRALGKDAGKVEGPGVYEACAKDADADAGVK